MRQVVAYYRVSTDRQGESGLGIEAQMRAVQDFVSRNYMVLVGCHVEMESGGSPKRPILEQALAMCKRKAATLVIAKLDRLGRNVAFIASLLESRVEFIAVDMPHANHLMVHIMAAFAEHEREAISTRTKEALQAAKRRGVRLGGNGIDVLSKKNRRAADAFARKMQPVIARLKREGFSTMRQISGELNERKILPYRGKGYRWHPATVCTLQLRYKKMTQSGKNKKRV